MSEELLTDDQSHYEVSLTAGQAFIAFVLLLLSLAASFAFGLMIGRGQADERLVVRKEPAVISEAGTIPKKVGRIEELGVSDADVKTETAAATATAGNVPPMITEETATVTDTTTEATTTVPAQSVAPAASSDSRQAAQPKAAEPAPSVNVPHYAQLLSTGDQKTAEALAARLINGGFNSAYVERGTTEKGPVFRVRVRFASESDARAAEQKLREYSKDVWITKQ